MSKLQIIAEKSKNLTLNADLSQSMVPLSSKLIMWSVLNDTSRIYPYRQQILNIRNHFVYHKVKKMGTYRRRQTRRHLSDFLCLQRICTWKTVYFISICIRKDQTSNEQEINFPPTASLVFQYLGVSKRI